eukprot:SAG11_NODE_73_length_18072_cov_8.670005_10_plen_184_part_00
MQSPSQSESAKMRKLHEYNVGQVNRVVKELVTDLLVVQPTDTIGFMVERLLERKAAGGSEQEKLLAHVVAQARRLDLNELKSLAGVLSPGEISRGVSATLQPSRPPTQIVIFGPHGTGVGKLCGMLSKHYGLRSISTAETLRAAMHANTPAGDEAGAAVAAGQHVPEDVLSELMIKMLKQPEV